MKTHRLTRSERRDLNRDTGAVAEKIAADEYAAYSAFQDAGEFDLATESGSIAECKATLSRLSSGARGRFRLFENQHEALVRRDRSGTAYYVFVLFDLSGRDPVARLKRQDPADVGNLIGARGGWNRSGHSAGKQHKLPIDAVF